jgi:hypothetical protein
MRIALLMLALGSLVFVACKEKTEEKADTASAPTVKAPMELLDSTHNRGIQASFDAFSRKDIDAFTADMDDNIMYMWSGGDSLVGKQAVKDYYAGRFKLIENISFSNHIFMPVMANVAPAEGVPMGKWVLHWAQADVTYKNGKSIRFWMHQTNHYNTAGKLDYIDQYIDRAPIMEATKGM